ncbi:hypothetical protein QQZ08_003458 [Neonectria magnoliae]|uniref:Uncharacterized protein n=1 Tax=Neonectria magnoliae TaxID=2732573 RepID=A0ABR1IBD1_9HYPO
MAGVDAGSDRLQDGFQHRDETLQDHPTALLLDPDHGSESAAEKPARLRPKDLKYNGFRNFSCPLPSDEDGEKQLLYVYGDMSNWWEWEDWNDPLRDEGDRREWVFEKDLRAKDEAALELLLATVRERRRKLHVSNV